PAVKTIEDHSRRRFAPVAGAPPLLDYSVFMVGAILELVDMGAEAGQFLVHPAMQPIDRIDAIIAARNAGLIGHHECQVASVIAQLDGFARACNPFEILDPVYIGFIDIQHAVAVEEYGGTPQLCWKLDLRSFQVGGNTDVDEEAIIEGRVQLAFFNQARKHGLFERARHFPDEIENAALDEVYARIDRPTGKRAGAEKAPDQVTIEQHAAVTVAGVILFQRHAHNRRRPGRRQIKQIEIEKGIAVQEQKLRLQRCSRVL